MHLMWLSVLSNIADIFENEFENCGLQLEGIFLKISKRFKSSFEYVNIQFHRVVGVESVNWTLIKRNYKATSITWNYDIETF